MGPGRADTSILVWPLAALVVESADASGEDGNLAADVDLEDAALLEQLDKRLAAEREAADGAAAREWRKLGCREGAWAVLIASAQVGQVVGVESTGRRAQLLWADGSGVSAWTHVAALREASLDEARKGIDETAGNYGAGWRRSMSACRQKHCKTVGCAMLVALIMAGLGACSSKQICAL
eukprot:SAG22_NODE_228_length_14619_cov_4.604132_6_plen_180_part_00